MSIKKQFLKSKPICKVTFKIDADQSNGATTAQVIGSFNNWDQTENVMKPLKTGGFSLSLDLETGKEYQFRYLLDGKIWINDPESDAQQSNEFNEMNDILSIIE